MACEDLLRRFRGSRPEDAPAAKAENRICRIGCGDGARSENPTVLDVLDPHVHSGWTMTLERAPDELRHRRLAGGVELGEAAWQENAQRIRLVLLPGEQDVRCRLLIGGGRWGGHRALEHPRVG